MKEYKLWSSSFVGPNIRLNILFSNILSLHSSLKVREHVWQHNWQYYCFASPQQTTSCWFYCVDSCLENQNYISNKLYMLARYPLWTGQMIIHLYLRASGRVASSDLSGNVPCNRHIGSEWSHSKGYFASTMPLSAIYRLVSMVKRLLKVGSAAIHQTALD